MVGFYIQNQTISLTAFIFLLFHRKELILKPILISVIVEVCAQVFVEPIDVLDITQASTSFDVSTPAKKRKIDVSFKTFIENLSSTKIIPW